VKELQLDRQIELQLNWLTDWLNLN